MFKYSKLAAVALVAITAAHGAACHGCALVAETSCEMRNDYLDRALVVPVLGLSDAAFFGAVA